MRSPLRFAIVLLVLAGIGVTLLFSRASRTTKDARATGTDTRASTIETSSLELATAPPAVAEERGSRAPVDDAPAMETDETSEVEPPPTPAAPGASDGLLRITVRSKDTGLPVAGIRVSLSCDLWDDKDALVRFSKQSDPARGVEGDEVWTRPDGTAELIVPSGVAYLVRTWSEDEMAGEVELSTEALGPGEERFVLLEPPTAFDVHFRGRIVDAVSGIRLASAKVRLLTGYREIEELATTESAGDGSFELDTRSWLRTSARIELEGYSPMSIRVPPGHETLETERTVRLRRSATLEILVSGIDERPGAVGQLHLSSHPTDPDDVDRWDRIGPTEISWNERTDSAGVVRFSELPVATKLYLKAEVHEGERRVHSSVDELTLEPGESRTLVISLGSRAVTGRVVDNRGLVVSNLELWLIKGDYGGWYLTREVWASAFATTTTTEDGRFLLDALTPGTWSVGPAPGAGKKPRDDGIASVLTHFTIPESGDASLELRVHRDLFIRGRVVDVDGRPPRKCAVTCRAESGSWLDLVPEDDGSFGVGPLAPGTYSLSARPDWNEGESWLAFRIGSEAVVAAAGTEEVTLHLRPAGVIQGRIERSDKGDPTDAWLDLFGGPHSGYRPPIDIESDGSFSAGSIEPGVHCLRLVTGDDLIATASVHVGPRDTTSGVVLRPVKGAEVMIDFDPDPERNETTGRPLHRIDVVSNGIDAMSVWAQGDEALVVPAGDVLVRILREAPMGGSWVLELEQSFSLAVGDERTVTFRP